MLTESHSDDVTTTGLAWEMTLPVADGAVSVLALDLGDMASGDELEVFWYYAVNPATEPGLLGASWTITATGSDPTLGFLSPPMPGAHEGEFRFLQSLGVAFDMKIRVWQVT